MADMVYGAIGLVIFLVVVFIAGYFLYKFKNARLTSAWGPLVGLVNGKVVGDGGGAASSWLTGTYRGRAIAAKIAPKLNKHEDGGDHYNYFDVALRQAPGKVDWNVGYSRAILGMGQSGWQVKAKDAALEAALRAAGVAALVAPFGETPAHFIGESLTYSAREQLLRYQTDITPRVAPTPQEFTAMLDMLFQVDEINRRVNQ